MAATAVFLLEKFHGQRNLMGYSPWGHKEFDMTEQLTRSLLDCALGAIPPPSPRLSKDAEKINKFYKL